MPGGPLPGWITADVIAETRAVWQPFYEKELTDDEAVGLLLNVGTLFRILRRKQDEEAGAGQTGGGYEAVRGVGAGQQP
jgi:hypothetical protein